VDDTNVSVIKLKKPFDFGSHSPRQKRVRPLEPLKQEEWDGMHGKARWDSIVALRGPDFRNSQVLKWFTTSVIRFRLSGIMRTGGLVNNQLGFVVLPSNGIAVDGNFDINHFLGHVTEAATWLGIPICWIGSDLFEKAVLNPSLSQNKALLLLYNGTVEEPYRAQIKKALIYTGLIEEDPCQE
jgi:hypothetical protein